MSKVSVVLPVYNVEKYVAKSISSILEQTYTSFELIVVIDGSKDNSEVIARGFEQIDDRVKVYNKPNGGLSDARNYGLSLATGEFIYFLDSDDWIEPDLLQDNLKIILEKKLDFIVFGFFQDNADVNDKIINQIEHIPKNTHWLNGDSIYLTSHMLNILGYAWNKIYRKDYLSKHNINFIKGVSLVEDILFNMRVYQYSNQIIFNQTAYVHYIQRPEMTLTKKFHEKSFEWVKLKHIALSEFIDAWSFNNKQEILANNLIGGLRYCVLNLFRYKNQYNYIQKIEYIKKILNDADLVHYSQFYKPITNSDKIYHQFIKYRAKYVIAMIAQARG